MAEEIYETVYEHMSGNPTFTITAAERWSKAMVHRLKEKYPDEVDIRHTNPDGSMVVRFPFSGCGSCRKSAWNYQTSVKRNCGNAWRLYVPQSLNSVQRKNE